MKPAPQRKEALFEIAGPLTGAGRATNLWFREDDEMHGRIGVVASHRSISSLANMSTVDVAAFKEHADELIAKAIAGEATVIEQDGKRAVLAPCEGTLPDFAENPQLDALLRERAQAPGHEPIAADWEPCAQACAVLTDRTEANEGNRDCRCLTGTISCTGSARAWRAVFSALAEHTKVYDGATLGPRRYPQPDRRGRRSAHARARVLPKPESGA